MRSFPAVNIEIKPSQMLKGEVGLFATRDINKGSIVVGEEKMGENLFISWFDFEKFDNITKRKIMSFCLGNENGFYTVDDLNYLPTAWYMNHSCDGNIGFDHLDNFIAIRDIKVGEELCWDYGLAETNPNFSFKCKCGSRDCRSVITGNDWKNDDFRRKNKQFMLSTLR